MARSKKRKGRGKGSKWLWIVLIVVLALTGWNAYQNYIQKDGSIAQFHKWVEAEKIEEVVYYRNVGAIEYDKGSKFTYTTNVPEGYYEVNQDIFVLLEEQGVEVSFPNKVSGIGVIATLMSVLLPVALIGLIGFMVFKMASNMGVDKIEKVNKTGIGFDDIAGYEPVKKEIKQVVRYLTDRDGLKEYVEKVPKGILLEGEPGNGKTLWAKALAGEAGVPFYYISGAEIEGMFVSQGATKVKSIFKEVRNGLAKEGSAILFIDEIDAVGSNREKRTVQETNQTIDQLLTELDGIKSNGKLLVMGATNLAKALDPALTRSGRFDRIIHIPKPSLKDRKAILQRYLDKRQNVLDSQVVDVDYVTVLAQQTRGMSGSDLELVVNDASLLAFEEQTKIEVKHLRESYLRKVMGLPRDEPFDEETEMIVAYHEAAHAVASMATSDLGYRSVAYGTIQPYGSAGGHVALIEGDEFLYKKSDIKQRALVFLAGRVIEEEILNGDFTSGAQNDLMQVNKMVHSYVVELGMSENHAHVFEDKEWGNWNQKWIKEEVSTIRDQWYKETKDLIKLHRQEVEELASHFKSNKFIDADQIKEKFEDVFPRKEG